MKSFYDSRPLSQLSSQELEFQKSYNQTQITKAINAIQRIFYNLNKKGIFIHKVIQLSNNLYSLTHSPPITIGYPDFSIQNEPLCGIQYIVSLEFYDDEIVEHLFIPLSKEVDK